MVFRKFISNRNEKKTVIKANKRIYIGLVILALSKIEMYEYWCNDLKKMANMRNFVTLLMMLKKSMTHQIKCVKDHYQWVKIKKIIGLMKDELGGKIMKESVGLRTKCYLYLMDDGEVDKKAKGTKKCVIKRCLIFNNYVECLEEKKKILRSQKRFESEEHDVYTEETNKIALSCNDDKRLISYDQIATYP